MPSVVVRILLFISSYFPLALIFWILFITQQPLWAWLVLGVGALGLLGMLIYFFQIVPKRPPILEKITGREARDSDVMGYIASYIVPFVTFPLTGWQQLASLLVFVLVLGVVYINSDMIRVNPMLNIIGYHLYAVTVEDGAESYALITRRRVRLGETLRIVQVGAGIFLEKDS